MIDSYPFLVFLGYSSSNSTDCFILIGFQKRAAQGNAVTLILLSGMWVTPIVLLPENPEKERRLKNYVHKKYS